MVEEKQKEKEIEDVKCSCCGSANVELITRVTGFFSKVHGWNKGKLGELRDRKARDATFFKKGAQCQKPPPEGEEEEDEDDWMDRLEERDQRWSEGLC